MKRMGMMLGLCAATVGSAAQPATNGVRLLSEAGQTWSRGPIGVEGATPLQAGTAGGPLYLVLARYAKGERSPPHLHPDARIVTVMRGSVDIASGPDMARRTYRAGQTVLIPANTPHYTCAPTGPALLQEVGSGQTGATILPPPS